MHYQNGGAMPALDFEVDLYGQLKTQVKKWITPGKIAMTLWSVILLLLSTGWLMIPAKSGDLILVKAQVEAVGKKVEKLDEAVDKIGDKVERRLDQLVTKLDKLQADQQRDREELLVTRDRRAELAPAAAVVPVKKRKGPRPPRPVRVKQASEKPSFFEQPIIAQ